MALSTGTRLGPYEIQAPIGAGGMGEVYRARDTRLARTVAIKVLPAHLSSNPDLKQRFEREARTISSLNHPHICTLYDIGHQEGTDFLVMEHLEGETLAQRLQKGPLPADQLLRYAIQITDALDKAHRQGVTHRDLKPANVMLTKAGAKLLDFGLAKLRQAQPVVDVGATVSELPTEDRKLTVEGTILGTFQYMAPEQLEGGEADARTDIFALGAVLYEMATSRPAFLGRSKASLIAAILEHDPESMTLLQPMTPPALERVVKTCLAKDPDERWQTAHDVLLQLKWLAEAGSQAGMPAPVAARRKARETLSWALAAIFLMAAAVFPVLYLRRPATEFRAVRFAVPAPEKAAFGHGLAVSPDGRRLAFVAGSQGKTLLWVRSLDSLEAQPLAGTEGANLPFWSPDSRFLGFFAEGKLKKIEVSGGPAQTLCEVTEARGGTWNREGLIVFAPGFSSALYRVPAVGGAATQLTALDPSRRETSHRFPYFLPDGKHFLYLVRASEKENTGVYVGSLDSKAAKLVVRGATSAVYAHAGFLLFVREGTLLAQPFDPRRLEFKGEPFPAAEKVRVYGEEGPTGYGPFSVSENGILAHWTSGSRNTQLFWFNRAGKQLGALGPPGILEEPCLSPDEKKVAIGRGDPQSASSDIWVLEFARGIFSRFTFHPANEFSCLWSPDGSRMAFTSNRSGTFDLYQKVSSGAGEDEVLFQSAVNKFPEDWSPDGRFLVFDSIGPKTKFDLWMLPLFGDRKPQVLLQTEFYEIHSRISPDGRWIAYASDESGKPEVYVRPFPGGPAAHAPAVAGKWQVSSEGGDQPQWRRDSRELFYLAPDKKLMSVQVEAGSTFQAGAPRILFQTSIGPGGFTDLRNHYVVTGDGQRFLVNSTIEATDSLPITVVLNWAAGVRK